jgi:hypothetical protein
LRRTGAKTGGEAIMRVNGHPSPSARRVWLRHGGAMRCAYCALVFILTTRRMIAKRTIGRSGAALVPK